MSAAQPTSPSLPAQPPSAATPPSRRYLPPYVYRSSPPSSSTTSPHSTSPSSHPSSRPPSRTSSRGSTRSVSPSPPAAPGGTATAAVLAARGMAKGRNSGGGSREGGGGGQQSGTAQRMQTPNRKQQHDDSSLSTPTTSASASASPGSPAVLSPASVKSIILSRGGGGGGGTSSSAVITSVDSSPTAPAASSTAVQSGSEASLHGGEQVKRTVEQLTQASSGAGSAKSGKRATLSALESSNIVSQRRSDYLHAASAQQTTPTPPTSSPHADSTSVAQRIEQLQTPQPAAPPIQHTQHKWTPSHMQSQTEAAEERTVVTSTQRGAQLVEGEAEQSSTVEFGDAQSAGDRGHTGLLHSGSSLQPEQQSHSTVPHATANMQPQQSALVQPHTKQTAASTEQISPIKLTRKQKKAQKTARVDPPTERDGSTAVQQQPADKAQPVESVAPARSERVIERRARRVWQTAVWSVWAALLLCACDLLLRLPNGESALLCALTSAALLAATQRLLQPTQPVHSAPGVSQEALSGVAAVAAAALPFLFAQRLRSAVYVSSPAALSIAASRSRSRCRIVSLTALPSSTALSAACVCVCVHVCALSVAAVSAPWPVTSVRRSARLLPHSAGAVQRRPCQPRDWRGGCAVVAVCASHQRGEPAVFLLLARSAPLDARSTRASIRHAVATAAVSGDERRAADSGAAGGERSELAARE